MIDNQRTLMPLIPLRGLTVFPYMVISFDAGREKTVAAVNEAVENNRLCLLVSQKDATKTDVGADDVFEIGTIARIKQVLRLPGESVRVFAEGLFRGRVDEIVSAEEYFEADVTRLESTNDLSELETAAMARKLAEVFEAYGRISGKISGETMLSMLVEEDVGKLSDTLAAGVLVNVADRQRILDSLDVRTRAELLLGILRRETEIQKIEVRIQKQVKSNVEKAQKEYYLKEQLKVIHRELGDDADEDELDTIRNRLEELPLPKEVRAKADKELKRYAQLPSGSHEVPVVRNWLDWLSDLPWGKTTEDNFDLENARKILNDEHYGLEKVKDRIVEHLAVCKLKNDTGGSILCLVGPPGVGKTSIASSIAHAMGRAFTRMSLGGVRDEADIRGHRRTYIGAIPGRFISAMKQAGSMNPVVLLDEVDKLCSDMRGDPASALLEVLDSNQNTDFRDHYMEIPFDLSKALFITTANSIDTIPQPLLDRMDVITLSSYTIEEKLEIGKRHLLPKQVALHGLPPKSVSMPDESIYALIEGYTREAGVRELERRMGDICRKVAVSVVTEGKKRAVVTPKQVEKLLGKPKFLKSKKDIIDKVGVANGLAWTRVGGEMLRIEVAVLKGKGKLELTGRMGDVMRESAQAAYTYIRTHAAKWDIDPLFYEKVDLHIHIPEGAVPKDGPSAGITMAVAMVSALSGRAIKGDLAMTGEISLRGRVMPVGGLKEKTLAALREGMTTVVLPKDNAKDLPDFAESVRKNLNILFAEELSEVFDAALAKKNSIAPFIDEMCGYRAPAPEVVS